MNGPYYEGGRYWGRITEHRLGKAKTGTPQLILRFQIMGMIDPGDPDGNLLAVDQQYERTVYRTLTDKNQTHVPEYVLEDLSVLGFAGGSTAVLDQDHPEAMPLRGKEMAFYCEHKEKWGGSPGEMQETWSIGRATGGGKAATPLEDKEQRQLDALFGKAIKMNPGAVTQAKAAQTEQQAVSEPTIQDVEVAPAAEPPPMVDTNADEGEDHIPF